MSTMNAPTPQKPMGGISRGMGRFRGFREGTTILIILVLGLIMSLLSPVFLTGENFSTMFKIFAINGLVVIGMTLVMIGGGIDLSVAAVMALVGVVAGQLFLVFHWNIWVASLAGLCVGIMIGFLNGFFVTRVGLSPFIVTLALSFMARGLAFVLSQAMPLPLNSIPNGFKFIGRGTLMLGIPFIVVLFLVVAVIFDFLTRRSTVIRRIYYVGSNEKAARFSGINVNSVRMGIYVLSGILAAIAGIFSISRFNSAPPYGFAGVEMTAICAAVIGGTSMNGGEGSIFGAVLGIAMLAVIETATNLLEISPYLKDLITGAILLTAVSIDMLSHRKRA
jgi:ribose transport system permease protein